MLTRAHWRPQRPDGNQPATINTANQLFRLSAGKPQLTPGASAASLPDYFARLTGVSVGRARLPPTSGLLTPGGSGFGTTKVFNRLGIRRGWFGGLAADRTVNRPHGSRPRNPEAVVRSGAHDSACAVHSLPIEEGKRLLPVLRLLVGPGCHRGQTRMSDATSTSALRTKAAPTSASSSSITGMCGPSNPAPGVGRGHAHRHRRAGRPRPASCPPPRAPSTDEAFATPATCSARSTGPGRPGRGPPIPWPGTCVIIESFARRYARDQ